MIRLLAITLLGCIPPKPLWTWNAEAVPIIVLVDEALEPHYLPAIDDAIEWWNNQAGRKLFNRRGELRADAALVIVMLYRGKRDILGLAERLGPGSAVVYLRAYDESRLHARVVRHELGHVLGLAHEKAGGSLMFPAVLDRDYMISDDSWCLLKDLYGVGPPAP